MKKVFVRFIAVIAAVMLCFCSAAVFAVDDEQNSEQSASVNNNNDNISSDNNKEDKKKEANPGPDADGRPRLGEGETGILVDAKSGRTLFEVESGKRMYPASTTKIMTALLAIEAIERGEASMDDQIEVTHEMLADADPDGSNIALIEGEIMSLENLLRGLLVASGNDAACAIAEYIGKSRVTFVDMMNKRAAELGAADTHFENPNGLHSDNHYTTAADMAKIACAAMKLNKFRNIADIAHVKIPPTNKTEKERYYINTNGLLSKMRYTDFYYYGSIGIKTGYTSNAGNCLVSAAQHDNMELIGVIFGGKTAADSHKDSSEMLDYGFNEFTAVTAVSGGEMLCEVKVKQGKGTDFLTLTVPETVSVLVPVGTETGDLEIRPDIPDAVYAPVNADDEVGKVSVILGGEKIGEGRLIANRTIERSPFWPAMKFGEWLWGMRAVRIIVFALAVFLVVYIIMFIYAIRRNIKKAKARKRRNRRIER